MSATLAVAQPAARVFSVLEDQATRDLTGPVFVAQAPGYVPTPARGDR